MHQNRLSAEMQEFRNRPNCLVIVYHDFEKSGIQFISILGERGFENAYLLTGGIEEFILTHGGLVDGKNKPKCENKVPRGGGEGGKGDRDRTGGHGMVNGNGKVELYRQGQFNKKSEGQ